MSPNHDVKELCKCSTSIHVITCHLHVFAQQACWKGCKQRKLYKKRMDLLQKNVASVVKVIGFLLLK